MKKNKVEKTLTLKAELEELRLNKIVSNFIQWLYTHYLLGYTEFKVYEIDGYVFDHKKELYEFFEEKKLFDKKRINYLYNLFKKIKRSISDKDFLKKNQDGENYLTLFLFKLEHKIALTKENRERNSRQFIEYPGEEACRYKPVNDNRPVGFEFYGALHRI